MRKLVTVLVIAAMGLVGLAHAPTARAQDDSESDAMKGKGKSKSKGKGKEDKPKEPPLPEHPKKLPPPPK